MMKRKFLAVVLPIIGCATVVGSGFSAWYFGDTVVNGEGVIQLGIDVSEEVKGSITITDSNISALDSKKVMLDQGGLNNTNVDSGICIVGDSVVGKTFNIAKHVDEIDDVYYGFTVNYVGTNTSLSQIYDAGMKINVSVTIDFIGANLFNYIELQDELKLQVTADPEDTAVAATFHDTITPSSGAAKSFVASIDITDPATETANGEWIFKLGMSTKLTEGNYKNEFLKYKDSLGDGESSTGKPNATGEPEIMADKLTGAGIRISTLATLA